MTSTSPRVDAPKNGRPTNGAGRKVLAIAQRPSDYTEMRRCLVDLHKRGHKAQLLYYCIGDRNAEAAVLGDIASLQAEGVLSDVEVVDRLESPGDEEGEARSKRFHERLPAFLQEPYLRIRTSPRNYPFRILAYIARLPARAFYALRLYARNYKFAEDVLDAFQPAVIILPEDVVGAVTPIVIKAGHERNIASVILPYTIANQQEAFRSLKSLPNYQFLFFPNLVMGLLFPRWVMKQENKRLVRLPAQHMLAHVKMGIQPPDPWMMNSGFANVIAVENEAMRDYYRKSGIPDSKLAVVGAFYDDYLSRFTMDRERELAALRRELGIDNTKPILLVGGCPDQSHNSPSFAFKDMDAFCKRLGQALQAMREDYEIIVRPHPNHDRMGELLAAAGIRKTRIDTARLVALCDLYVAFASATIRWSIACAKPTINYDVFNYRYDDFENIGGVIHVRDMHVFEETLQEIRPNSPRATELRNLIAADAPRWGKMDGKSGDRIEALIEGFAGMERIPRTSE